MRITSGRACCTERWAGGAAVKDLAESGTDHGSWTMGSRVLTKSLEHYICGGYIGVSQKKKNKFFFRDFVVIWCNDVRCMNYKGIFYYSELR